MPAQLKNSAACLIKIDVISEYVFPTQHNNSLVETLHRNPSYEVNELLFQKRRQSRSVLQ